MFQADRSFRVLSGHIFLCFKWSDLLVFQVVRSFSVLNAHRFCVSSGHILAGEVSLKIRFMSLCFGT